MGGKAWRHHVKKRILWLILLAAGVAGVWAVLATSTTLAAGRAQKATPSDDEVNAIARQLYCPVCENIPLDVCPTQACAQWRALIREKLAAGWTEKQIKDYFVEQYGVRVLNEPPRQGWNWLIYVLPALFLIGGAILLFRLFRSWKTPVPDAQSQETLQSQPSTGADEYLKRFEEEADKRK
jgi:cytochrome c-type biogenesis protein CcmH